MLTPEVLRCHGRPHDTGDISTTRKNNNFSSVKTITYLAIWEPRIGGGGWVACLPCISHVFILGGGGVQYSRPT